MPMDPHDETDKKMKEPEELLQEAREHLFLCQSDLRQSVTENIALRNFIQNLYESCDALENTELEMNQVLHNLKENIRVFARDHQIRL